VKILALETSSPYLVFGWLDGQISREEQHLVERAHAEEITLHLKQFGVFRADVIAVGAGPGSYTGVRVAASFALGLAQAWNARIVRVPTLEAIAAREQGVVAVAVNAHRGHVYSAIYQVDSSVTTLLELEKRPREVFLNCIPDDAILLEDFAPSGIAIAKLAQQRLLNAQNLELLYL
jgi:tRNA threonylcarbamoyladenosine biosynthesis protein TsaB